MNLKTILIIFVGLLSVAGAVIAMSIGSGSSSSFEGGMAGSTLPRAIPQGRAGLFDKVPAEEADNRATINNTLAQEALAAQDLKAYTAAPVIQIEGTSGDGKDPMAGAIVSQEEGAEEESSLFGFRMPFSLPVDAIDPEIEVATAPNVNYKVQEQEVVEPEPVAPDTATLDFMMGLTRQNQGPSVVVDSFNQKRDSGASPMQSQDFR